jgi:hypothetical protein
VWIEYVIVTSIEQTAHACAKVPARSGIDTLGCGVPLPECFLHAALATCAATGVLCTLLVGRGSPMGVMFVCGVCTNSCFLYAHPHQQCVADALKCPVELSWSEYLSTTALFRQHVHCSLVWAPWCIPLTCGRYTATWGPLLVGNGCMGECVVHRAVSWGSRGEGSGLVCSHAE